MKFRQVVFLSALGLGACQVAVLSSAEQVQDESTPHRRRTCAQQVEQVQPPPTGEARDQYTWRCQIERQFNAYLAERKTCAEDSECTVVQTNCPFGCGVAVAKLYATAVATEHDRLLAEFNKRSECKYKCNPVVSASCERHRCLERRLIDEWRSGARSDNGPPPNSRLQRTGNAPLLASRR